MEILILAALVVVVVVLWVGATRLTGRLQRQEEAFRQEMAGLRQETQSTMSAQVGHVVQAFNQQLTDVRTALQKGLADAGQLTSQAQTTVGERLSETAQLVAAVREQLGGLQEAGRELRSTSRTLESVLTGARTRGALGEVALERLLADALPQETYTLQYRFRSGGVVDAAVKLGDRVLPIDSKFPLDAYRRLIEAGEDDVREQARREFARAVRKHAEDIAEKYLLPSEGTLEVAFLFLASEGVYQELLATTDSKGSLADDCRSKKVIPVSPNTLYAYLMVILMGLRGLQVEENARALLGNLAGLQTDLQAYAEVHGRLGTHLKNAVQSYQETSAKLEKLERSLGAMAGGNLPDRTEFELVEPKNP